ncbi:hypothetical protein AX14_008299 [Amanita brunnescens Koide BX004]|nr:hypothetical protein AX14_008299 [Amanita brunnescens Koide BX004]
MRNVTIDVSAPSASFPLTTTCVPFSHALAAPSADIPLHRRRSITCWVAMPPKKVSFKAPAASSSPSNPITPPDDPAARLRSLLYPPPQPASAGKTSTPHDVASLKADLVNLQEKYDFLMEAYENKRADFRALSIDHSALQHQFETLTTKFEQVSSQLSTSLPTATTAAASEPTRPLTKDHASCAVQTDLTLPTPATVPDPPSKKTYAKATKASAAMSPVQPDKAPSSIPTQPFTPDSAPSNHTPGPFKGWCTTKPNELHVQLHSRAAFNSALSKYSSLKLNHRHALLDAFVSAVSAKITNKTHPYFHNNRIKATFWSPRGNLIIRMKRTPSTQLYGLLLDTLEMLCDGKKFVVLTRPTLSLLKLCKVPTRHSNGAPVDVELVASELFRDSRITNASFWHLPRFVSYKGAPPGRTATLFFSLIDSPQYALGRSLVNTTVSILRTDFKVLRWIPAVHDQQTMNIALGGPSFYKERLPAVPSSPSITASPSRPSTTTPTPTAHSLLPTMAIPRTLKPLSPRTHASPSLMHLRAALAAHTDIKRDYPNLFVSYDS